jgi:hypothetical protein
MGMFFVGFSIGGFVTLAMCLLCFAFFLDNLDSCFSCSGCKGEHTEEDEVVKHIPAPEITAGFGGTPRPIQPSDGSRPIPGP